MAINIVNVNFLHTGLNNTPEIVAAHQLKDKFTNNLDKYPNAKGTIYIFSNISIFGYQIRDIDLIIIGLFENFRYPNKVFSKNKGLINGLYIDSFICNIELKDHAASEIVKQATSYWVKYKGIYKNATEQAFKQMFSFLQYIKDNTGGSNIRMANLLWMRGLDKSSLKAIRGNEKDNALHSDFNFNELLESLLLQFDVEQDISGNYRLNSFKSDTNAVKTLINSLKEKREIGGLTRKKFELISQNNLETKKLGANAGEKITIMTGRAGTGKTVQLLQLAFLLANESNDNRCLLLTYNNALVCDIKRLIDYSSVPCSVDSRTVAIKTIDSFFQELMLGCGIIKQNIKFSNNYKNEYSEALKALYSFVVNALKEEDIDTLKELATANIDWDYILIDEAQDWTDIEKQIILKIYGPQRIIVADGVDQFIKTSKKQNWDKGIADNFVYKAKQLKIEMRQKSNIVYFINAYSQKLSLGWHIEPNNELLGGKIKIYSSYNSTIHNELQKNCKQNDCENYDILILVPPTSVTKNETGTYFSKLEAYQKANISIFDGTNPKNRSKYPSKDLCRVYQYDSCRGLEGWAVVCYDFDELIAYKMKTYIGEQDILGFDPDLAKKKFVYTWSLMPLTRPVDTLVITLKEPNSEVGKILKELSIQFEDIIEWNI